MADLLLGTPRVLRFCLSAELGGHSTSWKFASRSRSRNPDCSTGSCSAPHICCWRGNSPPTLHIPHLSKDHTHNPSRITLLMGCLQCHLWSLSSHRAKPTGACGRNSELLVEQQPAHPQTETPRDLRHFQVRAVSQRLGFQPLPRGPALGGSCQATAMQKSSFASSVPNICTSSRPPPWQPGLCCLPDLFLFFILHFF